MNIAESFSEWREERLYVLHMIEDLKAEQRRQSEAAAIARVNIEDKLKADVRAAHDKIRALETTGVTMGIKNWIMTVALSVGGAVVFEIIRSWISGK